MFDLQLKKKQWGRVSEILGNLGILSLASIVIPFILDNFNPPVALIGLVFAIVFWYYSLYTSGKS